MAELDVDAVQAFAPQAARRDHGQRVTKLIRLGYRTGLFEAAA